MTRDRLFVSGSPILWIPDPIHELAIERARELGFDVLLPSDVRLKSNDWKDLATAVILRQGQIQKGLEKATKLKIIARSGTGFDTVNVESCSRLNIAVSYLPGFNAKAVAEHVLALTLSLTRRVSETSRLMKAGKTLKSVNFMAESLEGRTIGLIGMGNIAREVAIKFQAAFSCRILVYSPTSPHNRWTDNDPSGIVIPHERCSTLADLLARSHIVSLHCPVTEDTTHIIDAEALSCMPSSSYLINAGRGRLVDEQALCQALTNRSIAGAALDCFEIEPPAGPFYDQFLNLENLVVTPHLGATTEEMVRDSTIRAVDDCASYLNGFEIESRAA